MKSAPPDVQNWWRREVGYSQARPQSMVVATVPSIRSVLFYFKGLMFPAASSSTAKLRARYRAPERAVGLCRFRQLEPCRGVFAEDAWRGAGSSVDRAISTLSDEASALSTERVQWPMSIKGKAQHERRKPDSQPGA